MKNLKELFEAIKIKHGKHIVSAQYEKYSENNSDFNIKFQNIGTLFCEYQDEHQIFTNEIQLISGGNTIFVSTIDNFDINTIESYLNTPSTTDLEFCATAISELHFISNMNVETINKFLFQKKITLHALLEHVNSKKHKDIKEKSVGKKFAAEIIEKQITAINFYLEEK